MLSVVTTVAVIGAPTVMDHRSVPVSRSSACRMPCVVPPYTVSAEITGAEPISESALNCQRSVGSPAGPGPGITPVRASPPMKDSTSAAPSGTSPVWGAEGDALPTPGDAVAPDARPIASGDELASGRIVAGD